MKTEKQTRNLLYRYEYALRNLVERKQHRIGKPNEHELDCKIYKMECKISAVKVVLK